MIEINPGAFYRAVGHLPDNYWKDRIGFEPSTPTIVNLMIGQSEYRVDFPWYLCGQAFHCGEMERFVEVAREEGQFRVRLTARALLAGIDTVERPLAFTPDVVFSGVRFDGHVFHYSGTSACGGSIRFAAESLVVESHEPDEPIFAADPKFLKS